MRQVSMHLLFRFLVFAQVSPDIEIRKKNNQRDHVYPTDIKLVSTEATINVQGRGYVNHNYHELSLFKKQNTEK